MINDLGAEATTVHARFASAIVAFIVAVPEPCLGNHGRKLIAALTRLCGRETTSGDLYKAEAIGLIVWHPGNGSIDANWPPADSPLRIERFSQQVEACYTYRFRRTTAAQYHSIEHEEIFAKSVPAIPKSARRQNIRLTASKASGLLTRASNLASPPYPKTGDRSSHFDTAHRYRKNGAPEKVLGAVYTPPRVAAALTRWAIRSSSDTVLDPSCGEGVFLVRRAHPAF